MEQDLIHKRKQLDIYKKEGMVEFQSQDRTAKIYEKLNAQLAEEQTEREYHVKNLEDMIEEKLALININSAR